MRTNMKGELAKFVKHLSVLSGILFLAYGALAILLPEKFISKAFWGFIPFFYVVILLSKLLILSIAGESTKKFSMAYVQTTVMRFLLYLVVLLLYAFSFPEDAKAFIITFFLFYFAYTIFEVTNLYKKGGWLLIVND